MNGRTLTGGGSFVAQLRCSQHSRLLTSSVSLVVHLGVGVGGRGRRGDVIGTGLR
jgi:hypothetical protein